jgi:hypothetical protein
MQPTRPTRLAARFIKGIALAGLLAAGPTGCFLSKFVYKPVPVANVVGDSTTEIAGTKVHVYRGERYEVYGPTAMSVSTAVAQLNRSYREFAKHFGTEAPPMAVIIADSAFAILPTDAGAFAKRALHTFVYVRPHNLRDIEGVNNDLREEEIWPISARAARELFSAYVSARRHLPVAVESATHSSDFHSDSLPLWFVDAVVALLSDPGAPDRIMEYLRDHLQDAPSPGELLRMHRSAGHATGDSIPVTRDRRTVIGAAGVGLTLFAIEREGPRVVGKIFDRLLDGGSAQDVLRDVDRIPRDERELDRVWRAWVRDDYRR